MYNRLKDAHNITSLNDLAVFLNKYHNDTGITKFPLVDDDRPSQSIDGVSLDNGGKYGDNIYSYRNLIMRKLDMCFNNLKMVNDLYGWDKVRSDFNKKHNAEDLSKEESLDKTRNKIQELLKMLRDKMNDRDSYDLNGSDNGGIIRDFLEYTLNHDESGKKTETILGFKIV